MPRLELPSELTNELKLADWLEIFAILSPDKNSSSGDLESALNISSVLEGSGQDAIEQKCLEAFSELEERELSAGDAYPFVIDGSTLSLKPNADHYVAYLFCLCLSYFQWDTKRSKEINVNPWLLFEELSALAAAQYINGDVMNFGTSRASTKKAMAVFHDKIDDLCRRIGEGVGFRPQDGVQANDDKVDLVAWKNFNDGKTSKLIMFGQCAGGANWVSKLTELKPQSFWDKWTREGKVSPLLESFYIPHRIPRVGWDNRARDAGILFDRCRIAYWAFNNNKLVLKDRRYKRWYKYILRVPNPPPLVSKTKKNGK